MIRSHDVIFEEGTGHQTISEDQGSDEFDIFPINNTWSINNAQDSDATGCLLHDTNLIAPHNHLTDVPHDNVIQPQHYDPSLIPANQIPVPQTIQHSTHSSILSTNMWESRASVNEAHDMGENWASNSTRPHTMFMDLEESKLNVAYYIALMATSMDSEHILRSYMEVKKCLDLWQGPMEEEMEIMKQHSIQVSSSTEGSTCHWLKVGVCK